MADYEIPGATDVLPASVRHVEVGQMIDTTITRYMELCDVPAVEYSRSELLALFAEDAVWEGLGHPNQERFGRQVGSNAIVEMLESHLPPTKHFLSNTHLLTQRHVTIHGNTADGRWVMQRYSKYANDTSELTVTRLRVGFLVLDSRAVITRYQPEKLFSLGLDPDAYSAWAAVQ